MSIAAPPRTPPTTEASSTTSSRSGVDQLIEARIAEACRALWWAEVVRTALRLVIAAIAALLVWVVVDQWIYSPGTEVRTIVFASLGGVTLWYLWGRLVPLMSSSVRPEYAARSLERDLPELRQSLTSYITLKRDTEPSSLRSRVVRSMGSITAGRLKRHDDLPAEATGTLRWWVATAGAMALLVAYAVVSPKNTLQSASRLVAPLANIDPPRRVSIDDVQPGDIDAIAGRSVALSAAVDGLRDGEQVVCRWDLATGRGETVLEREEQSLRHAGELSLPHSASGEVPYTLYAGDAVAGPFVLRVENVPVVALQSVHYQPPAYTGQSPHTSSSGAITALDGTRVKILATTNRSVARAKIEFNPRPLGNVIQATAGATEMEIDAEGTSLSVSFPLRSARGRSAAVEYENYRIAVWDAAGQTNPEPIIYPIRVIADLPPEVSITMPLRSPKNVPIDAQQIIEVHASDPDYGLNQLHLEIRSGIDRIADPVLWSHPQGEKGNRVSEYRFRPARHGLQIGDTVQITAVATDNRLIEHDPSVEPNVTRTDPIELKITASEPLPREGDPNAGGLSEPDQRPASDHPSQTGEQEAGGGGQSGEQGETGEGQTGEDQTGEGQTGEDQTGESQTGEGQTGQPQTGEGQTGEPQTGEGQTGEPQTGEGQTGEPQTGEGQTGEPQTGEPQTGEGQTGQPQTGEGQTGQPRTGEGQTGESQAGESRDASNSDAADAASDGHPNGGDDPQGDGAGQSPQHDGDAFERIRDYIEKKRREQQAQGDRTGTDAQGSDQRPEEPPRTGESQSGESQTGESQTGESESGEPQTGESQAGESQTGESQTGESESGESQTGEPQTGEPQTGESQTGESQTGESESGESQTGESQTGESQTGESQTGESQTGESQTGESETGESQAGQPRSEDSQRGSSGDSTASPNSSSPTDPSTAAENAEPGTGTGTDGAGEAGDSPVPPDPVNLDYAKKATDMVLDYLEETRDAPDRDLLDELNWTEDDLKRFSERWQKVRELESSNQTPTENRRDIEEALRSLGLRPPGGSPDQVRESADSLRSIRDSGNRKPPPAAFRDAFDAFRRATGRQ